MSAMLHTEFRDLNSLFNTEVLPLDHLTCPVDWRARANPAAAVPAVNEHHWFRYPSPQGVQSSIHRDKMLRLPLTSIFLLAFGGALAQDSSTICTSSTNTFTVKVNLVESDIEGFESGLTGMLRG